jgi:hypothetical protein
MLKTNNSITSLGPSHVKLSRKNKDRILTLKHNKPDPNVQLSHSNNKSYDSGDCNVRPLKAVSSQQNYADNARCNVYFDGIRGSETKTSSTTDRSRLLQTTKNHVSVGGSQTKIHRHGRQVQTTEGNLVADNEIPLKNHELSLLHPKKRVVAFVDPTDSMHHTSILKPSSYQRKELRKDRRNANDIPSVNHQVQSEELNKTDNSNSTQGVPSSQHLSHRKEAAFQLGMLIDDLTLGLLTSLPCIGMNQEAPK